METIGEPRRQTYFIKRRLCELFGLKYTDLSHHEVPPETQGESNEVIYRLQQVLESLSNPFLSRSHL